MLRIFTNKGIKLTAKTVDEDIEKAGVASRNIVMRSALSLDKKSLDFPSLCTDVPTLSGKIGRGDVCESPTIIVFPFPRNVGDSL